MNFIKFCIETSPFASALFVGLIIFGCIFYWRKHSKREYDEEKNKWGRRKFNFDASARWELLQVIISIVVFVAILWGCNRCMKPSPDASKDFNEWTGEPRNQDPFNYYNRRH